MDNRWRGISLDDPIDYIAGIRSARPPGEAFEYLDLNPLLLTLLVEHLTQMPFDVFVEQEIWQHVGAEADALFMTAANGRVATPLGFSSTLRDMARFGLLFTPAGQQQEEPLLSAITLQKIQFAGRPALFAAGAVPNLFRDTSTLSNTYQWDHVTEEGDFYKDGHAGQGLYISPSRDLVIAFFGSWAAEQFSDEIAAVARQLATSGLFER